MLDDITTPDDIARIRCLLDPLFERFDSLGERAVDLGGAREPGMAPRIPEINGASALLPALRKTLTYAYCREVARQLLGVPVGYLFDHAIYKSPHNNAPTAWHQDEAYNSAPIPLRSIHFWIPLQPVSVENGCMWFVPGSHLHGLLPHKVIDRRSKVGTLAAEFVDTTDAVACPLPLGGATIHHPLTLHYTGENQFGEYRRAWILHFGAYGRSRFLLHPKMLTSRFRALMT